MPKNDHAEFDLYWHNMKIGELSRLLDKWEYRHDEGFAMPFPFTSEKVLPNGLPAFIAALLPEKLMFDDSLNYGERTISEMRSGMQTRLMSSLSLHLRGYKPSQNVTDLIDGDIDTFCPPGSHFSGNYRKMPRRLLNHDKTCYAPEIVDLVYRAEMPRISGCQVKIPSYLSKEGVLSPAVDLPFTHLLKVPGPKFPYNMLCVSEWYATTLAKISGVETEKFGIAKTPFGVCFVAQRFDIHVNDGNNNRAQNTMFLCEDMTSVLGIDSKDKYETTMEAIAGALLDSSTDPRADSEALIRQCVANWILVNSDYHAKNISILKEISDEGKLISSRLSPAYDIVCCNGLTSVESMAIPIAGEYDLSIESVRHLASYMRKISRHAISPDDATRIATDIASRIEKFSAIIPHATPNIIDQLSVSYLMSASGEITKRADSLKTPVKGASLKPRL